ncbi:MAGE-like protein 2 [Drosophila takahashii]|uniref:MAGE-like protein 2 n=1 Tax=Drosophila takahashii TaxID=29030 RepID=UPI0007E610B4
MFRIIAVIFALFAVAFAAPGYIEPSYGSYGVVPVAHVVPVVKHVPVVKQVPVVQHVPVVKHVPVVQHVPVLKSYAVPTYGHHIYHG